MIDLTSALGLIREQLGKASIQECSLDELYGRILAEEIISDRDYPPFNRSTMDGFALKASDLEKDPRATLEIKDTILAGESYEQHVLSGSCVRIMTGAPVPDGPDTVVRVEEAVVTGDRVSFPDIAVSAGKNIAYQGEDKRAGVAILSEGSFCNHAVIATLASVGRPQVQVFGRPSVSILATGDELRQVDAPVLRHQIRDSNSWVLRSFLAAERLPEITATCVADDPALLAAAIRTGLTHDILLLSGGVSMGVADIVPALLKEAGVTQVFHKVSMKPGKPIWFGVAANGSLVFGLPGNPFAVQVCYKIFVEPVIHHLSGDHRSAFLVFPLADERQNYTERDEFFPCLLNTDMTLQEIRHNGSGDITAGTGSDGIALHPGSATQLSKGYRTVFYPWSSFRQL